MASIRVSADAVKMDADIRRAAATLSTSEARFLVDAYYQMQENRKRSDNQVRAQAENDEPHEVLRWFAECSGELENRVRSALDVYSRSSLLGKWARAQKGIGPVITAGLLAHVDLDKAQTAGAIWRFAGLDPTVTWGKGQKRPWNASLKTLCWKIGESFVKVSGRDGAIYGQLYVERRAYEQARNDAGELAEQAAAKLRKYPDHAQAAIYREGKLPDGQLHARAKRWAVKLFLAHYFEVGKRLMGEEPPRPYPVAHLEHAHYIEPPGPKLWE